jgi:hypothetical protein
MYWANSEDVKEVVSEVFAFKEGMLFKLKTEWEGKPPT